MGTMIRKKVENYEIVNYNYEVGVITQIRQLRIKGWGQLRIRKDPTKKLKFWSSQFGVG